jgi:hypothetical protein
MGIRTYKEQPCATGDSAIYFVAVESPNPSGNILVLSIGEEFPTKLIKMGEFQSPDGARALT